MAEMTIGEFSKVVGLTVKALRFYHDKELLIPARVEFGSGYRYYDESNIEPARKIVSLRELGFSVEDIRQILSDSELTLEFFEKRKDKVESEIASQQEALRKLDLVISQEKRRKKMIEESGFEVERRRLEPMLIAGIRMQGYYHEMGGGFGQLGKAVGQQISGPGQCLCFDEDHREGDANFEPFFEIRTAVEADGISVRELPGGDAICLKHLGPYEELGRSYAKMFEYAEKHGLTKLLPTREVFLKGPDFKGEGNPDEYLTELQILVEAA